VLKLADYHIFSFGTRSNAFGGWVIIDINQPICPASDSAVYPYYRIEGRAKLAEYTHSLRRPARRGQGSAGRARLVLRPAADRGLITRHDG
jgi:hypothetical protein